MTQRHAKRFADDLRGRRGSEKLAAAAWRGAGAAAKVSRFLQREFAVNEAHADRLHAPRIVSFDRQERDAAGHEDRRQIVDAGKRHHHRRQALVAGRDADHAAPGGQRSDQPPEDDRRIVAIGEAVEHRRRALRSAVARIGARRGKRNRAGALEFTRRRFDEQTDFPVTGVIAERDWRAVRRAHAAVRREDQELGPPHRRRAPNPCRRSASIRTHRLKAAPGGTLPSAATLPSDQGRAWRCRRDSGRWCRIDWNSRCGIVAGLLTWCRFVLRPEQVYISYWLPATVAVVADDLTGAADAAAGFLRARLGAIVTWADPDFDSRLLHETDVLAVDARTRVLQSGLAAEITSKTVATLFEAGVTTLYKKIDSTLRGHIGVEVGAALGAWRRGSLAIVAPAFPAMGRVTIDGRVRVHGVVLDRPAIATLLTDAGLRTRTMDLSAIRRGGLANALIESRATGIDAVVCDAEIDKDLITIAGAGRDLGTHAVWVGAGGLTHALATNLPGGARSQAVIVPGSGGVLIVIGSATEIAAEQAAHLRASGVTGIDVPSDVAGARRPIGTCPPRRAHCRRAGQR